jgi:alpha-L-fucosidase 2
LNPALMTAIKSEMNKRTAFVTFALLAPTLAFTADLQFDGLAAAPAEPLSLYYRRPAKQWVEALPIGNGRLGAMVFGGVNEERLQLNEDTLWAGGPYDPVNPEAKAALPEARQLIFDGKYREAGRLIGAKIMARPLTQMPYQTIGDLLLSFPEISAVASYRRDLNLDTAVATVTYNSEGVKFTREVFASPIDQVIVVRLTADKPGRIGFTASMKTPQKANVTVESGDTLVMTGSNGGSAGINGALRFQARAKVIAKGGKTSAAATSVSVANADSAVILIAGATSYRSFKDVSGDPAATATGQITAAAGKSYSKLLNAHVAEHQRLFRRVSLDLGTSSAMKLPTNERIESFARSNDPHFATLYFQYARYLLISSSRPGTQPAGLQGIWNESMNPPWGGKYTININTEMNYWPAEACNLAECVEPLIGMVKDLSETGARTAANMYGARGWVTHHNTDLWRATAPIDGPAWGMWPLGGAWLSQHLWDHYEFSGDKKYLAEVYPVLKGAAIFFLDTLVEEPRTKWLVTNPSLSPENGHPFGTSVCAGPTMDSQILRDLFANCIQASELLNTDADFRNQLTAASRRLAPNQIGKGGQLQEWLEDWDAKAPEQQHRHISHLYGLYPSSQINVFDTPDLAAATKVTLNTRGDITTGWAIAWRINCWARLHDGERTFSIIRHLFSPSRTYPNMFDAHPPFQIDGNFGGASGITEMLLQSRALTATGGNSPFEIELLPALTTAWSTGNVKGLRARGGFDVDLQWKEGKLAGTTIRSTAGNPVRLRYGTTTKDFKVSKGKIIRWDGR